MYLISKLLLNSLYGKFAMDYRFDEHLIITENELDKLIEKGGPSLISEIINLENNKLFVSLNTHSVVESNEEQLYSNSNYNISISIASAITSYSRIYMSHFKNCDYNLYYTDTDSIYIDKPLNENWVGTDLGQMKLENYFKDATFLAPKVYGGVYSTGELTKVKGFKNHVKFKQLKSLLNKNKNLILEHDKWFRSIEKGNITINKKQKTRCAPTKTKTKTKKIVHIIAYLK